MPRIKPVLAFFFAAFCAVYVFSGLFREKMFDMVMLIGSLGIILVYCIADMAITVQNSHQVSAVKIVSIQISDHDDTITY